MEEPEWLVGGNAARYLLDPISPAEFVSEYFGRRPLFIKGRPDKFAALFSARAFQEAVDRLSRYGSQADVTLKYERGEGVRTAASPMIRVLPQPMAPLLQNGATLCFSGLDGHDPLLEKLVNTVRLDLGYPGRVLTNAYMSAEGAGFATHFDARIVSGLQIEGSKTWRFSRRPALPWPTANARYNADGSGTFVSEDFTSGGAPDPEPLEQCERIPLDEFDEVTLEPGDMLILPAGTWHSAKAGPSSLALNLAFNPYNFSSVVDQMIRARFVADRSWRGVAPLLPSTLRGADAASLRAQYVDYVKHRMAELKEFLASLEPEDPEVIGAWAHDVLKLDDSVSARIPARPRHVERSDRFKRREGKVGTYAISLTDDGLQVYVDDGHVTVQGASVPFVRALLGVSTFVAGDAMGWGGEGRLVPWEEVAEAILALEASGLVERVSPA